MASFLYGIVLSSSTTLFMNYEYISTPTRKQSIFKSSVCIMLITTASSLIVRSITFWVPFVFGFRILSLIAIILLAFMVIQLPDSDTLGKDFLFFTSSLHQHSDAGKSSEGILESGSCTIARIPLIVVGPKRSDDRRHQCSATSFL